MGQRHKPLTLTPKSGSSATLSQFQAALRAVRYNNSAGTSADTTNRVIAFLVNDGGASNNTSNIISTTVTVGKTFTSKTQSAGSNPAVTVSASAGTTVTQTTAYSASSPAYALLIDAPSDVTPVITTIDGTADLHTTTDRVPTISGTSAPGVTLNIYYGGSTLLGSSTADNNGNWSLSVPSASALGNAIYSLTARDTIAFGTKPGTAVSSAYSLTISNSAPTTTVTINSISNDTAGISTTDFVTSATTQTISATLSTGLTAGQKLMGSLDGGKTWIDVSTYVSGTAVSWAGASLNTGYASPADYVQYAIQFKVTNASGDGLVTSQDYLVTPGLTAPTITGTSFQTAKTPTLFGTGDPKGLITIKIGGVTLGTTTPDVNGNWSFTVPEPLNDATYTFTVTETDPASGAQAANQPTTTLTIDSTLAYVNAPILISTDTGKTSSDFITKTASQTISTSLNQALSAGQTLWGSVDGGTTWTDVTSKVSGTTVSWNSATLAAGSNIIEFQVRNVTAGSRGTLATRSYVLDTTAPTLSASGAVIDTNAMVLMINFNEAGSGFDTTQVPSANSFTVKQNGSSVSMSGATVTIVDTDTVQIILSGVASGPSDTFTVSYSGTTLRDVAGNQVASFSNVAVINPAVATASTDSVSAQRAGGLHYTTAGSDPTGNVLNNDTGSGSLTVTQAQAGSSVTASASSIDPGTSAGNGGVSLTGSYGTLVIGADGSYKYTVNNANATLKALSAASTITDTFSYQMTDEAGTTSTASLAVTVQGNTDLPGPTLDSSKSPAFTNEKLADSSVPTGAMGTLVSQLINIGGALSNMTDSYPAGYPYGIAITATNTTTGNGTWYYTMDGGATWTNVGTVSNASALLLSADSNTRLYYVGNGVYTGTITNAITFRAWDQGTGTAGTKVDTSTNGGTSVFSSATDTAALTVTPNPNVAPTWTNAGTTITVNANSVGNSLNTLLAVTDSDTGQTETWTQYVAPSHGTISLGGGAASGSSGGTGLLPTAGLVFTPNAGYAGTDTFTVYETDGAATISKIVTVTVTPGAPTITRLEAATDSGTSTSDGKTNVTTLKFAGTGAAYGTGATDGSDIIVFVDVNGNGVYNAGTDRQGIVSADTSGNWTGAAVDTTGVADGTYNVYAQTRSTIGSVTGALSAPLSITIDRTAPLLTSTTPADNAASVSAATTTLSLTFDSTVRVGTGNFVLHDISANSDVATIDATSGSVTGWGTNTLTVTLPNGTLQGAHHYSLRIASTAVLDDATNAYAGIANDVTYDFTVANTAPTYTNATTAFTVAQNAGATDISSYLVASDSDTLQIETWTVQTAPDHGGTITLTTATANSGGAALPPTISYRPNAGYYGTETFTIRVSDGTSFTDKTFTVTVDAKPVVTATATNGAYTEQAAAAAVDSAITIADADNSGNGNWNGGSLKVQITANADSHDVLALPTVNGGGIWNNGGTIQNNLTAIGTLSSTAWASAASGQALTIIFNGNATSTDVQTVARAVTFADTNNDPSTGTRTVTFTATDSSGASYNGSATRNVVFTLKNDTPTFTATAANPTFTENGAVATLFSAASVDVIEAAQKVQKLTLTVGTLADGAAEKLVIDNTTVDLSNGNSVTTGSGYAVVVGVDGANLATVTITKTGNFSGIAAASLVTGLKYQNTSTDPHTAGGRTVTLTSVEDDGGGTAGDYTKSVTLASTVTLQAVNNAPTLSATTSTPTFTEKGTAVSLFSSAAVSAIEAGQKILQVQLTVNNVTDNAGADEVLSIDGYDVALNNGNSVTTTNNNGYTAAVSLTGGTATVTIAKIGGFSADAAQALVNSLTYKNTNNNPVDGSTRAVTLTTLQDDGGTSNSGADTRSGLTIASTVTIRAVNDAPTLSVPDTLAGTAGGATLYTSSWLADVDAGNGSMTVTVTAADTTNTLLHVDAVAGLTINSGNDSSVLSISGTVAVVNQALQAMTYANNTAATDTLTVLARDGGNSGAGGEKTATKTVSVSITQNDTPVVAVPGAKSFSLANNAVTSVSVTDATHGATVQARVYTDEAGAKLTFDNTGNLVNFTSGTNGTDHDLTFTGSLANINTVLATLNYTAAAAGNDVIHVEFADNGSTLGGGLQDKTGSNTIAVTNVANDAPVVKIGGAQLNSTGNQGSLTVTTAALTAVGSTITIDDTYSGSKLRVTAGASNGTLNVIGSGAATITGNDSGSVVITGTQADINTTLATLKYATTLNVAGNDSITVSVDDQGTALIGGAMTNAGVANNTSAIAVTVNGNAAPTVAAANNFADFAVADNTLRNITNLQFADTDIGGGTGKLTLSAGHPRPPPSSAPATRAS
jgi:VCBS repeat-containing protein